MSLNRESIQSAIFKYSYKENHDQPFVLASGKISPYYFDLKSLVFRPAYLKEIAEDMYELILSQMKQPPGALGGLTMGSDPIIYATTLYALERGVSIMPLIVRKETKDHGSQKRVEGILDGISGKTALIDDVITTGKSTLSAYHELIKIGAVIDKAFCVVDRNEGGKEALREHGVELFSLYTVDDFKEK